MYFYIPVIKGKIILVLVEDTRRRDSQSASRPAHLLVF